MKSESVFSQPFPSINYINLGSKFPKENIFFNQAARIPSCMPSFVLWTWYDSRYKILKACFPEAQILVESTKHRWEKVVFLLSLVVWALEVEV